MQIQKIHFQNFRLFEDLEVDFDKRLNIFLGVNGSGKSALLDGSAILLSGFLARLIDWKEAHGNMYYLKNTDIKFGSQQTNLNITINHQKEKIWNWTLDLKMHHSNGRKNINLIKKIAKEFIANLEKEPNSNIPIIAYYSANRAMTKKTKNKFTVSFPQLSTFKNALNPTTESFSDFEEWFTAEEGYEDKIRLEKDHTYRNPILKIVRNVLYSFFNVLGNDEFSNLRVKKDRKFSKIVSALAIQKGTTTLELSQLSSGEKLILSTIVDITHRLSIANPTLTNPLEGTGIVLIDEIDLHLHPKWQRTIVPALLATFPNLQFIITTHSPQVLSNVKQEHIFIIQNEKVIKTPFKTYGKDSNLLLNQLFQTDERPSIIKQKILRSARLLDQGKFEEGKMLLTELAAILGENDPAVIEANTFLEFYAN